MGFLLLLCPFLSSTIGKFSFVAFPFFQWISYKHQGNERTKGGALWSGLHNGKLGPIFSLSNCVLRANPLDFLFFSYSAAA